MNWRERVGERGGGGGGGRGDRKKSTQKERYKTLKQAIKDREEELAHHLCS